ncbi:zinc-binding dehydrogenase [bacterium]|nr:zinc-binding dehydrogenase [bacterium]
MLAAVCIRYGPPEVVALREVEVPEPGPGELLIRVVTTTVSSADWRMRALAMPRGFGLMGRLAFGWSGLRQPILGSEAYGRVERVGPGATRFREGDMVVAFSGIKLRSHAEFVVTPESGMVVPAPPLLAPEQAGALFFGGTTARHFLVRCARLQPGQELLVLGASGAVGSAAVQLGRHLGARVTAVCSGANAALMEGLGADAVVDYQKTDLGRSPGRFDAILDCVNATHFAAIRGLLRPSGVYLMVAADLPQILASLPTRLKSQKALASVSPETKEDVEYLASLVAEGKYRPLVDSVYALSEIARAHARVETGRKRGNVVIRVSG